MLPVPQTQLALVFKNMVFLDTMDSRIWTPDSECSQCPRRSVLNECQRSEKVCMQINAQKSKVMAFHETPAQKTANEKSKTH